MNRTLSPSFRQAAIALALCASSVGASALNAFTLDPSAAGLAGSAFTADNLLISDYATVTQTGPNTFSETGFLSIGAAQLNNGFLVPSGLNSTYGLFIAFSGQGTNNGANPLTSPTSGVFTSMSYTLYGYNGTATFNFVGTVPTTTAVSPIVLATGTLVSGSVSTSPDLSSGSFTPSANARLTIATVNSAVLSTPSPFFNQAITSFTNTTSQVQTFANGFMIQNGGGSINFASVVPEPSSYAMLMAGLGAVALITRRRSRPR